MLKNTFFLIGLLLSISTLWPLAHQGYFTHHDDVQVIRLYEMDKCIKDFQFPCRWVPDLGEGYGYPIFNFYAPLPYYIGEIFYLVTGNFITAAKLLFAASVIGAYLFMFLLGKKLWGNLGGTLSAIFYTFVPYHAVNLYVRGAMGELWAMTFFPLIFYFLLRLSEKVNLKNAILLSISIALLVVSHNLSFLMFAPAILLFTIILYFKNKNVSFLKYFFISLVISLILSAFYWLPAALEGKYVHLETMTEGYFSYTEHFKGLRKLFVDRTWSWGPSIREVPGGERDQMPYQIGWIHLFAFLIALGGVFVFLNKKAKYHRLFLVGCLLVISASVFMIHPRSIYVWKLFDPVLKFIQFPWRFLILISFFISLPVGSIFLLIKKNNVLVWFILVLAVFLYDFSYFRPEKFKDVTEKDYLSGSIYIQQLKRSIFDYLPIYAVMPPAEVATDDYKIRSGDAVVSDFKKGTDWINMNVVSKTISTIELSQYYFPGWKVDINGRDAVIDKNNYLGLITFSVNSGENQVRAKLYNTPIRIIGNILSVMGIFGIGYFFIKRK